MQDQAPHAHSPSSSDRKSPKKNAHLVKALQTHINGSKDWTTYQEILTALAQASHDAFQDLENADASVKGGPQTSKNKHHTTRSSRHKSRLPLVFAHKSVRITIEEDVPLDQNPAAVQTPIDLKSHVAESEWVKRTAFLAGMAYLLCFAIIMEWGEDRDVPRPRRINRYGNLACLIVALGMLLYCAHFYE